MKKLFIILFMLPVLCFGKSHSASFGGILAYTELVTGILAIISILISVYLCLQLSGFRIKLNKLVLEEKVRKDSEDFKKQMEGSLQRSKIENELPKIDNASKDRMDFVTKAFVENMFNKFDERIIALEDPKLAEQLFGEESNAFESIKDADNDTSNVSAQSVEPEDTVSAELAERICYAKLTGIEGGFEEEEFLSQQNGEQIYMLRLKENEGTFTISDNTNAQKYALSDVARYLKIGCEYLSLPDRTSKIITKTPGTLHKSGKQWLILDKAVIEFV